MMIKLTEWVRNLAVNIASIFKMKNIIQNAKHITVFMIGYLNFL